MGQLWERIKGDFRSNPGVWIGVAVSAAVLMLAYLAYRHSQTTASSSAGGTTTAGLPDWSTAQSGDSPGGAPSNAELQAEISALEAFLASSETPNPPGLSGPPTVTGGPSGGVNTGIPGPGPGPAHRIPLPLPGLHFPVVSGTPTVTGGPSGGVVKPTVTAQPAVSSIIGTIQNPTTAAQLAHRPRPAKAPAKKKRSFIPTALLPKRKHTKATTGHGFTYLH